MPHDVTIIIPVYNRPHLAEEAIQSALAQDGPPAVIVVDDKGGVPMTPAILAWAEAGTIKVVGDRNRGTPGARNFGARHAATPYILFLDDDDHLAPGAILALRQALELAPDAAAAGGGERVFSPSSVTEIRWPPDLTLGAETAMAMCPFHTVGQVLFRREAFEAVGGFDETVPLCEDWDLYVRLCFSGRIVTPRVHVVDYRLHDNRQSATTRVAHMAITLCGHYRRHPPAGSATPSLDAMVEQVVDAFLVKLLWEARRRVREREWAAALTEARMSTRLIRFALASKRGRAALRRARSEFHR